MTRVLVAGASGFSGRAFRDFLEGLGGARDRLLAGMDIAEPSGSWDEFRRCDACDARAVREAMLELRPDIVVNLTGSFSAKTYEESLRLNTEPTRAICEAALDPRLRVKKILVLGSAAEYGAVRSNPVREGDETRPVGFYGLAKVFQTHLARFYAHARGLPVVVARPFNIVGKGQSSALAIGNWERQIEAAADGGAIKAGNLETKRDYIDIRRAAEIYWLLANEGAPGEIYNVCSGEPRRMRDVLEAMISESGKRLSIEIDPSLVKKDDIPEIYGSPGKAEALWR